MFIGWIIKHRVTEGKTIKCKHKAKVVEVKREAEPIIDLGYRECTNEMKMKVFVVNRKDEIDYDEYTEQTIVASSSEKALELANKEYGEWKILREVDLTQEQVLTKDFRCG